MNLGPHSKGIIGLIFGNVNAFIQPFELNSKFRILFNLLTFI